MVACWLFLIFVVACVACLLAIVDICYMIYATLVVHCQRRIDAMVVVVVAFVIAVERFTYDTTR